MKQKIIIVNGSPRKEGTVSKLLKNIADGLPEEAEIHWYTIADMKIAPCRGCMNCRQGGVCILPADDAHIFAADIHTCDSLIVGTPVYWGNMNGQLKMLFDRIVPALMQETRYGIPKALHKGKTTAIVTACTTPWPFNIFFGQTGKTVRALKEIFAYAGFRNKGTLIQAGTKKHQIISPGNIKKAHAIAHKLAAGR
jgi:multimeric flavodoxin WrbA